MPKPLSCSLQTELYVQGVVGLDTTCLESIDCGCMHQAGTRSSQSCSCCYNNVNE